MSTDVAGEAGSVLPLYPLGFQCLDTICPKLLDWVRSCSAITNQTDPALRAQTVQKMYKKSFSYTSSSKVEFTSNQDQNDNLQSPGLTSGPHFTAAIWPCTYLYITAVNRTNQPMRVIRSSWSRIQETGSMRHEMALCIRRKCTETGMRTTLSLRCSLWPSAIHYRNNLLCVGVVQNSIPPNRLLIVFHATWSLSGRRVSIVPIDLLSRHENAESGSSLLLFACADFAHRSNINISFRRCPEAIRRWLMTDILQTLSREAQPYTQRPW